MGMLKSGNPRYVVNGVEQISKMSLRNWCLSVSVADPFPLIAQAGQKPRCCHSHVAATVERNLQELILLEASLIPNGA